MYLFNLLGVLVNTRSGAEWMLDALASTQPFPATTMTMMLSLMWHTISLSLLHVLVVGVGKYFVEAADTATDTVL